METVQKELPSLELVISILKNEYTLKNPDTGQFIDIEVKKVIIANERNDGLMARGTEESIKASFLIDAIATFSILIPQLEKDINTTSIYRLTQLQSAQILQVYLKKVHPWLKEWQKVINDSINEINKAEEEN